MPTGRAGLRLEHHFELRWHEDVRDPVGVTFTPSGSVSTLWIEVAYDDGGVFDVDARVESTRGPRSNEVLSCRSRVEVAARLSVLSVDGGLDESWPDLIVTREGPPELGEPASDESTIVAPFTLQNLGGSLSVDSIEPLPEGVQYELRVRGSDDGELLGKIIGLATYPDGAAAFELASFGTRFMTEGPEP